MAWITTSDVTVETWRHILEYANEDFALEAMERIHGHAKGDKIKRNYKKQIRQIRVSLLQAREYFLATEGSTLFTSANHLYYCMMSLVTAIMLLRGDGEKSLDFLRKQPINQNHGLKFTTSIVNSEQAGVGLSILENSYVEVRQNGHFMNWYSTLPPEGLIYTVVKESRGSYEYRFRFPVGFEPMLSADQIVTYKRSILNFICYLPDLYDDIVRYGVSVPSSRISYEIYGSISDDISHIWRIHNAQSVNDLEKILQGFKLNNDQWRLEKDKSLNGTSGTVKLSRAINLTDYQNLIEVMRSETYGRGSGFEYPSIRENLNHDQVIYVEQLKTFEIVDAYIAGFSLSMLSRYYPDLWIGCLESHCKAAQLIERFVFTLMRKFPAMALSVLAWPEDMVISTHRPPWFQG